MQDQCSRLVLEQVGIEATEPLAPRPLEANSRRVRDESRLGNGKGSYRRSDDPHEDGTAGRVPAGDDRRDRCHDPGAIGNADSRRPPSEMLLVGSRERDNGDCKRDEAGADETNPARTAGTEICSAVRALGGSDVDSRVCAPEHELAAEALGGGWSLSQLVAAVDGIPGLVTSDSMAVPFRRGNEWLISCAAFGRPRRR